jgi:preprotein translocase subunit SecE
MDKLINYIKEAYNELKFKVSWPTWPELQNSTMIVLVASLLIALVVFGMDWMSRNTLELFYGLFD